MTTDSGFARIAPQLFAEAKDMFTDATEHEVRRVLDKRVLDPSDFGVLLSPMAGTLLEDMAQKASQLTRQHFGKTIQLFTPLYLSSYCANHCVYCGFNACNDIHRSKLTLEQVDAEASAIAETGLKHILILTGEAPAKAGLQYLEACSKVLHKHFPSISIEVYAMDLDEYATLVKAGVDGLTIYQETYDEALYAKLHPKGPKKDFHYRLGAPERGCEAGMRTVNVGALLGLGDWHTDAFMTAMHAKYLMDMYPEVDIAVSLPRMRPHVGEFEPTSIVSDRDMVQLMLAMRLFLPRLGITVSTRENAQFREHILPLGVTKMSAGVSTAVGGHSQDGEQVGQFDISDERSVDEMCEMLKTRGFQPVFKDWEPFNLATTGGAS